MSTQNLSKPFSQLRLSVLDFLPVRNGQSTTDAVAASLSLVRVAETLGYERYWVAEHHNMRAVASTNPAVLIAILAAATTTIRIGSGGVLLPNQSTLVVAEQFALLEAAFPNRVDLGVGRAPGTDAVTRRALGHNSGNVDDLLALSSAEGAAISAPGRDFSLMATPRAASSAPIWMLGASEDSAGIAAKKGLPYVFGNHFGVTGGAEAMRSYRANFRPSAHLAEPRSLIPVFASVATTYDEAYKAALPWLLVMLGLHTGRAQTPMSTIEEAETVELSPAEQGVIDTMAQGYVIGDPDQAREKILALAAAHGVDEIMLNPIGSAHSGVDTQTTPEREQTLRLLVNGGTTS